MVEMRISLSMKKNLDEPSRIHIRKGSWLHGVNLKKKFQAQSFWIDQLKLYLVPAKVHQTSKQLLLPLSHFLLEMEY